MSNITEITEDDIREVLDTDESKSLEEITDEIVGERRCSECGHRYEEWHRAKKRVKATMAGQMNEITSTPDWEYRLARR